MFIVASGGRCGTHAICYGLDQYSDHQVRHEPAPRLLEEAYLKHHAQNHATRDFKSRMRFFEKSAMKRYGESFRAPNLLEDIRAVAPQTRFLVIVREPLAYVPSAFSKGVFQKGGEWDKHRILPLEIEATLDQLPIAEKIAWHWVGINTYLLDFAAAHADQTRVVVLSELIEDLPSWADFLGVTITDKPALSAYLNTRPNAAPSSAIPPGYDRERLTAITGALWERTQTMARG